MITRAERQKKSQLQISSLFTYDNRPPGEPNSPVDAGIQGQDEQGQYEETQCHALLSANAFNAQEDNQESCVKHTKSTLSKQTKCFCGSEPAGRTCDSAGKVTQDKNKKVQRGRTSPGNSASVVHRRSL